MKHVHVSLLLGLALACFIGGRRLAVDDAPSAPQGPALPVFAPLVASRALAPVSSSPTMPGISTDDILVWARRDPASAGAWLKNRPDDEMRQQALATVIRHWMRFDPRAAADFAFVLPDSPARARALDQVARTWVVRDPVAASIWAESLPAVPELDTFAAALATIPQLISSQLDTALSWAETITNEELRTQTLGIILDVRAARDRAANIYLVTTPRPATARKTLLASAR